MKKVMTLLNVINKNIQDLNLSFLLNHWIYKKDSGFWILVHIKKKKKKIKDWFLSYDKIYYGKPVAFTVA